MKLHMAFVSRPRGTLGRSELVFCSLRLCGFAWESVSRELREFGVPNIWVIDPETFEAEAHTLQGSAEIDDRILRASGTAIAVPLHELERD